LKVKLVDQMQKLFNNFSVVPTASSIAPRDDFVICFADAPTTRDTDVQSPIECEQTSYLKEPILK
jgi:hypothetical protein